MTAVRLERAGPHTPYGIRFVGPPRWFQNETAAAVAYWSARQIEANEAGTPLAELAAFQAELHRTLLHAGLLLREDTALAGLTRDWWRRRRVLLPDRRYDVLLPPMPEPVVPAVD
jgi:hypothetical protein